uniref:DEAD/DEAH box helicase n=1 Tax=Prevotella sp. GTC17259 TaxID=3236795 RepID=A0AB33J831_9BACT
MVDFKKKIRSKVFVKEIDPIQIYSNLDRQASAGPLRPVQEFVLKDWYDNHKDKRDIIVKLHTGEGKTLIGLLLLQSRLNKGKGPCLYVCPSKQLALQVSNDAKKFGIKHQIHKPGEKIPDEFLESKEILITYVQRLFNGRTQFGIDNNSIKIGTIVLDDSHACIDSIRNAFSIKANRQSDIYKYFLSLFEASMRKQGEGTYIDIKNTESSYELMPVPYWDWIDKQNEVAEYMNQQQDCDEVKFVYPLLKDIWSDCTAYFTGSGIEIIPDYNLIHRFTSFTKADQRILMSATTQDDSFFIKGLMMSKESVMHPLTNSLTKWSGEKMILFPTRIDKSLNSDFIREIICYPSAKGNISKVVLAPSLWWGDDYEKRGAKIAIGDKLPEEINYLRGGGPYNHTVVFVNRYDGIDLADNQCRILVLDSLPSFGNLSDRYEQQCREVSDLIKTKIAQKIEQGLGRSVRSEKDYSVILIIGEDLVRFIKTSANQDFFSPQTLMQIRIGENVSNSVKDEVTDINTAKKAFLEVTKQCLGRDEDWKQFYKETMDNIVLKEETHPLIDIITKEFRAEQACIKSDYNEAEKIYQDLINIYFNDNHQEKGWYLQLMAKCAYRRSKIDSESIQKTAHELNPYVLKPQHYNYKAITPINQKEITLIYNYLSKFKTYDDLQLKIDAILADLCFGCKANKFEAALQEIGRLLGYISQRPDQQYNVGPDNLWVFPNGLDFIGFECKNEILSTRKYISKEEVGQMNNHIGWFEQEYGADKNIKYIHIHQTNIVSGKANYTKEVSIITSKELDKLKKNIKGFIGEFSKYDLKSVSEDFIKKALETHKLTLKDVEQFYSVTPVTY